MPDAGTLRALESIAANVRRIRESKGMTQEGLANRTGLHLTYVQSVERGSRNISVGVLVRLADSLNVDASSLLEPAKLAPPQRGRPRKPTTEDDSK